MRFIDLFAGLGGFHLALRKLGHECVFASEIDEELCDLYARNFNLRPAGDLRATDAGEIPRHDVLCAGFPCQPFSKAGEQEGTNCKLWGDLFSSHVLRIIKAHKPKHILMENVANLERHDGGKTWKKMRKQLEREGYEVDTKVLSPHRFGIPQIRERLLIVGSRNGLDHFKWPAETEAELSIESVLDRQPKNAPPLSDQVVSCLETWQDFLDRSPKSRELPSFPIWTMEFGARYPYTRYESLESAPLAILRNSRGSFGSSLNAHFRSEILARVPSYARGNGDVFPRWKQRFIWQNRCFYRDNRNWIDPWLPSIRSFPSSLQKFEWNCKGGVRDIWKYVIQFRASGVRVKQPTTAPSLVAMTTTQVPIIAWERRYMTARECCRLQSMEELKYLPDAATKVCKAFGNAVNVEVVRLVAESLCGESSAPCSRTAPFGEKRSRLKRSAPTSHSSKKKVA